MRISSKLVGVGVLALMTGCSTLNALNPFASKDETDQPAKLVELQASMAVRTAWKLDIGKARGYQFSPALTGDTLVVAGGDGKIARVQVADGNPLWRIDTNTRLTAGVATDGNLIAVGAEKGVLMAFDMDGKALWKHQLSSEILSAPVVVQGVVVARSLDNRIVGVDAASGERKWVVQKPAPALTLRTAPGMIAAASDVIVAQPGGKLSSIVAVTGAPRWDVEVGISRGATELERVTDIGGAPVLFDEDVCAVSYQGRVACFNWRSGSPRWARDLSSEVGVAVDQRFVFAADDKGALYAFDRDAGASSWKNDKLAFRRLSTPVSYGRAVAVGDFEGYVHFLSREDGAFLARVATDGSPIIGTPLVAGTHLIFQTQNGTVAAIAVE